MPYANLLQMTLSQAQTQRRLLIVVLLTLLPWPAVWFGMYRLHSLLLTFFLYHGLCLLPSAYFGRRLWLPAWRMPSRRQWQAVLAAALVSAPIAIFIYSHSGNLLINAGTLLATLRERGFSPSMLWPLIIYFVPVNAVLEELFWRGVVLNELRGMDKADWLAGVVWTAFTFAAWHYLVIRLVLQPGWAELTMAGILGAGMYFSWLYRRTGSIVVPILWHALVFDLGILLVFRAALGTH